MLTFRFDELCRLRGVKFPLKLFKKSGISHSLAFDYLRNQRKSITLKHIEAICTALNSTPNDIFNWQPDAKHPDVPTNPLQAIRHQPAPDVQSFLNSLSVEELQKLVKGKEE